MVQSVTHYHIQSILYLQLVIGLVLSVWLLLHYGYSAHIWICLNYPVIGLCCGGPAALDLQIWSFHILQQFVDEVDVV